MAIVAPGNDGILEFMSTATRVLGWAVYRVLAIVPYNGGATLRLVAKDGRCGIKLERQAQAAEDWIAQMARSLIVGDSKVVIVKLESTGGVGRRWVMWNVTKDGPERLSGKEVEARFNQV